MSPAIVSTLDGTVLNAMRASRRSTERHADEKLALLHRLHRQFETKSLPEYTETQVEQSFNEQIFARVFGYRTLLSHDGAQTHHLLPKPHVPETGRFPDFTIGNFRANTGTYRATVELKNPGVSLTSGKPSAVRQAFEAVNGRNECLWVIVCNYRELRLYKRVDLGPNDKTPPPIVTAILPEIRDKNELARLCAHFDLRALLGIAKSGNGLQRSELLDAIERKHAAQPVNKRADHVRVIFLFTLSVEEDFALFRLEHRLRNAITANRHWLKVLGVPDGDPRPAAHFRLEGGYISATSEVEAQRDCCKVSLSGLGQLQVSASTKLVGNGISTRWLVDVAQFFVELVDDTFDGLSEATRPGRMSPELWDVKDVELVVAAGHQDASLPQSGKAETDEISSVDFAYIPILDKGKLLVADMVSELAFYFRSQTGGVGINRDMLLRELP